MARQKLILDRYRIIEKAGSGGYGTVQHAYDTRLKRDVAIKCIELSEADVARARLLAMEAKMADALASAEEAAEDAGEDVAPALPDAPRGAASAARADVAAVRAVGPEDVAPWEDLPADDAWDDAGADAAADAGARDDGWDDTADADDWDDEDDWVPRGAHASRELRADDAPRARSGRRGSHARHAAPSLGGDFTADDFDDLEEEDEPAADAPRLRVIGAAAGEDAAARPPATLEADEDADAEPELEDDDLFDHIPGLEEARTAAHLSDANIVTVYDCEVHDGVAYVIMEYIEGKTLARIMREQGDDITLDIIAAVFTSIAHALKAAHGNEVLHLDVKPDNVIVNRQGQVKVTDFGLATLMDASGQGTAGGGTIGYMPLEQMRQEPLDERTDEWALASLTYEMLSGDNPFFARDLDEAEEAIEEAELVLPSLCWDDLDQQADDIMFRALDPDPDERYDTVEELADELEPLLGSARRGKRQLADIVCEVEPDEPEEPPAPRPPAVPLVDRLGPRGGSVIARVLSAGAAALVVALALANVRLGAPDAAYGLATSCAPLFWGLVAAGALAAAIRPHLAALGAFVLLGAALFLSGAFLLGLAVIALSIVWWRGLGREGEPPALCALVQPLAGAAGFAGMAPVLAGALLPLGQALLSSLFSVFTALALASLGSCDLSGWNPWVNLRFAGFDPQASLVTTLAMPQTWCVAASWVLSAGAYSLLCVRGTRAFDILGAVAAAAILVTGACVAAGLASGGASWLPEPTAFTGALLPGCVGIVLALMGVPDRARWAPEEWDALEEDAAPAAE
ncbi:serine/threonine-protein kinase [Adlercreutzia faecimuris]|uniref:non-specific serine/threonine protein kinase n=1 Tax=Adlercreutzia faecimuris TaxID=2897341 RepID=A0ABS9WDT4_9ACTN|nr:serine/threonine-protein kinase [Adlercreutzia sp. JBNU-10]MCI2240969.1 protein kinase [Adlercreutzia sp. JBNU-10]